MELELRVERKKLRYRYGRLDELDSRETRKGAVRLMPSGTGAGFRWTFSCPNDACGALVKKLYLHEGGLLCRECSGVVYRSQFLTPHERQKRKATKLRSRLGPVDPEWGLPSRPKGMHQRTYERELDKLAEVDLTVRAILERDPYYLLRVGLDDLRLDFDAPDERIFPEFKRTRKSRSQSPQGESLEESAGEFQAGDRERWISWDGRPRTRVLAEERNRLGDDTDDGA